MLLHNRRRALHPWYHFFSSALCGTDLFRSLTLSAVTGGTCRSLTRRKSFLPPGSVRCSEAIFHPAIPGPSQQCRLLAPAGAFSVGDWSKCTLFVIAFINRSLTRATVSSYVRKDSRKKAGCQPDFSVSSSCCFFVTAAFPLFTDSLL